MKIISKHKDYYDNGMMYGIDEKNVFVRTIDPDTSKTHFVDADKFKSLPVSSRDYIGDNRDEDLYFPFLLFFCGKVYIGYKFIHNNLIVKNGNRSYNVNSMKIDYFYGDEIITNIYPKYKNKKYFWDERRWDNLRDLIKTLHGKTFEGEDLFIKYNTPYFVLTDFHRTFVNSIKFTTKVNLNISLKEFGFNQEKNAVEAFQEIEMFMSFLKERDSISEMTDKQKIHSHGLDETSFRCEAPGNKKHRRKMNKLKKRK